MIFLVFLHIELYRHALIPISFFSLYVFLHYAVLLILNRSCLVLDLGFRIIQGSGSAFFFADPDPGKNLHADPDPDPGGSAAKIPGSWDPGSQLN